MEFFIGFVYDVVGIRAIRKQMNLTQKLIMALGFTLVGFLLFIVLFSI